MRTRSAHIAFLGFFILLLGTNNLKGQPPELINDPEFRPVAQAAVDSVYNFQFDAADKLLKPWRKQYPGHPLWQLIEGMQLWWQVLSDLEDTSHDERFFYMMKRTDYEASKLLSKSGSHADALIIKAISNGYIARQHANRQNWITSINSARKALSAHEYLMELQPGLSDLKLAEGLKFYYAAYLPEAYPVVKTVSWFLPEGDKKKGLELMGTAADSAIFARAEATYFLGNINYNYEENFDKAASYFEELYNSYPRNNYYVRKLVSSLYKMRRYDEALTIIDKALSRWNKEQLPYADVLREELLTLKASILRKNNDIEEAIANYRAAFEAGKKLPDTRNRDYHLASGYYMAKLLYDRGEKEQARNYALAVLKSKEDSEFKELAKQLIAEINANR